MPYRRPKRPLPVSLQPNRHVYNNFYCSSTDDRVDAAELLDINALENNKHRSPARIVLVRDADFFLHRLLNNIVASLSVEEMDYDSVDMRHIAVQTVYVPEDVHGESRLRYDVRLVLHDVWHDMLCTASINSLRHYDKDCHRDDAHGAVVLLHNPCILHHEQESFDASFHHKAVDCVSCLFLLCLHNLLNNICWLFFWDENFAGKACTYDQQTVEEHYALSFSWNAIYGHKLADNISRDDVWDEKHSRRWHMPAAEDFSGVLVHDGRDWHTVLNNASAVYSLYERLSHRLDTEDQDSSNSDAVDLVTDFGLSRCTVSNKSDFAHSLDENVFHMFRSAYLASGD